MSYRIWHSPVKNTIVETLSEVEVYYQMQYATVGHYPNSYNKITEKKK